MFTETKLSSQDNNDMHDIAGYALFQNDNLNSSNGSRPYGGAAVNSKFHSYLDTPVVTIYIMLK